MKNPVLALFIIIPLAACSSEPSQDHDNENDNPMTREYLDGLRAIIDVVQSIQ